MDRIPKGMNSRRDFIRNTALAGFGVLAVGGVGKSFLNLGAEPTSEDKPKEEIKITEQPRLSVESYRDYESLKPEIPGYIEINKESSLPQFILPGVESMHGADTIEGKMIRTLRFKNITEAVEERYDLPKGILLPLIFIESTGTEYLGNAFGDGGFGLIHTQANIARSYGLKVYKDCNSLVCNKKKGCKDSDGNYQNHAKGLKKFIKENNQEGRFNRKALAEEDERLNHLLNIDMIGRMFALSMSGPALKIMQQELDSLESAIYQFHVGFPKKVSIKDSLEEKLEKENKNKKSFDKYQNYMNKFKKIREEFNDPKILAKLKNVFDNLNKDIKINGQEIVFEKYLELMWKQNENFGLETYKKLPKYELSTMRVYS